MKLSVELNIRDRKITDINKWIFKEGYELITHHENGKTILGLYKPAATKSDIPEFLKDLARGDNKTVNAFVDGIYAGLNICK